MSDSLKPRAICCNWYGVFPLAYKLPTKLPALVPVTILGLIPCDSKTFSTPIWAKPLAPPPPKATAITGSRAFIAVVLVGVLTALSQPARLSAKRPIKE